MKKKAVNSDKALIKNQILQLITELNYLNEQYYGNNLSVVSDDIFDEKLSELIKLEQLYPEFKFPESPTNHVGSSQLSIFKKAQHQPRSMLSLKNAFAYEDLYHFDRQIKEIVQDSIVSYCVEPKIDGLSISLNYLDGELNQAVTRGNGEYGELITKNIFAVNSIPKTISNRLNLNIRGELYLPRSSFKKLNQQRALTNEKVFSNPRNAAAGTIRQLDLTMITNRNLAFFAYEVLNLTTKKNQFATQYETLNSLKKFGFQVNSFSKVVTSIAEVIETIEMIMKQRETIDYDIDGVVIKVNDFNFHSQIGYTTKFPKWAIAYKFPAQKETTLLLNIFPTVGRTGRVTYNAKLKPVQIAGSIISRTTLHNFDYINKLDLRIGDIVTVKKAGDVIPKVVAVFERGIATKRYLAATICPICETKLIRKAGEVDQYCPNRNCRSRFINALIHFTSREAANVFGLSIQQLTNFVNINLITSILDIYYLKNHRDLLLTLPGYKLKSVDKLLSAIEATKHLELNRLLFGLGIKQIGLKTATDLAINFPDLQAFLALSHDDITKLYSFGETKAIEIINWINDPINRKLITDLIAAGVEPVNSLYKSSSTTNDNNNGFFNNKVVVVTGVIEGASRNEIKEQLLKLGAKPTTSISNKTDYLIAGKNPSQNKIEKINKDKIINVINIKEIINYEK